MILELGDHINTDDIIPAKRCTSTDPAHLARYAFEHIIGEGKLHQYSEIKAGKNFGCGSSREHAPLAIRSAGITKICAESFSEIFYLNSINIGLKLEISGSSEDDAVVNDIINAGGLSNYNKLRMASPRKELYREQNAAPMTIAEKIIARAAGRSFVMPGQVVTICVDLAMSHDAVLGPCAGIFYTEFGKEARVWDPQKVVLVADHFIQSNDVRIDHNSNKLLGEMRLFSEQQGCKLYDTIGPGEASGICHILLCEEGYVKPGMVIVGTDSHSCTYGALGCFSMGIGTTDMANVFISGETWLRVPSSIRVELSGELPAHLSAKDIILKLIGELGMDGATGKVLEFRGNGLKKLSPDERLTLSNMSIECGAMCGIIPPDEVIKEYISGKQLPVNKNVYYEYASDDGARYAQTIHIDLTTLTTQIACPPRPDKLCSIDEIGMVRINKAYIGSCTGGKLQDLREAAQVLKGRKIHEGVKLFVVAATQNISTTAKELGYIKVLEDAGATILKTGCGACINSGHGILNEKETGLFATSRNFIGRSGHPDASVYLSSPRVVAISAVSGFITDKLQDPFTD